MLDQPVRERDGVQKPQEGDQEVDRVVEARKKGRSRQKRALEKSGARRKMRLTGLAWAGRKNEKLNGEPEPVTPTYWGFVC